MAACVGPLEHRCADTETLLPTQFLPSGTAIVGEVATPHHADRGRRILLGIVAPASDGVEDPPPAEGDPHTADPEWLRDPADREVSLYLAILRIPAALAP